MRDPPVRDRLIAPCAKLWLARRIAPFDPLVTTSVLAYNESCRYYAADKAGIVILQDMVQHYGDGAVRQVTLSLSVCLSACLSVCLSVCLSLSVSHTRAQGGLPAEARYYWSDLKAMIDGIGNHPCIIQWCGVLI